MARKPDTATALQQARITLQGIEAQVSELSGKRRASLLNGVTAAEIAAVDSEIEKQKHAAQTERDRISLLSVEAEHEVPTRTHPAYQKPLRLHGADLARGRPRRSRCRPLHHHLPQAQQASL